MSPQINAYLDDVVDNLIRLQATVQGPFNRFDLSSGGMVNFNPMVDLELYVDGLPETISSYSYDKATNTYLLYMRRSVTSDNIVQLIHHMPSPPYLPAVATTITVTYGFGVGFGTSFGS